MLFKLKISEVRSLIEGNSSEIKKLTQQIEDLRGNNQELEDYLQKLGSAAITAQSALEQLQKAYQTLKTIDASQMEVLKQEADNLYLKVKTDEISLTETTPEESTSKNRRKNTKTELIEESEATAVEVEIVESKDDKSSYEAVLKLQKLLN